MVGGWLLVALCASVVAQFDSRLDNHWELWKNHHDKQYQNAVEEMSRRLLWEQNLMEVTLHNLEASMGHHTYTRGVNHLSDLSKAEFLQTYAPLRLSSDLKRTQSPFVATYTDLPASVDWRNNGYGSCGSCWAFSTVGALEGLWAKTTGNLVDFSPQNLMDCSGKYGTQGCDGGWMHQAFQYVIDNQGIEALSSYRYTEVVHRCIYFPVFKAANCSSYNFVARDEESLEQAVATIGPIAIAIDSSTLSSYSSGVYYNQNCGKELNHAVLLVGYGTDPYSGLDYWLVKNSWGTGWGEQGYIKIARNMNQMCGVSLYAVYPQ